MKRKLCRFLTQKYCIFQDKGIRFKGSYIQRKRKFNKKYLTCLSKTQLASRTIAGGGAAPAKAARAGAIHLAGDARCYQ